MRLWPTFKSMLAFYLLAAPTLHASTEADPIRRPIPPILIVREIPCADFMKYYFDWAAMRTPAPEDNRTVGFKLVYNQQKNTLKAGKDDHNNVVGYSTGGLHYDGTNLTGDVMSYFNDRTHCDNPDGGFCVENQPFSQRATDIAQITITPEGAMTTMLKSWGNALYHDQLVCMSNGVAYVATKNGQPYISVITMEKGGFRSPR